MKSLLQSKTTWAHPKLSLFLFPLLLLNCNSDKIAALSKQNSDLTESLNKLKDQTKALEAENANLKNTATFFFQRGIDFKSKSDFDNALMDMQSVIDKFPSDILVPKAKKELDLIGKEVEARKQKALAEGQEQRRREEAEARLNGVATTFEDFNAEATAGGVPAGKRFRFRVLLNNDLRMRDEAFSISPHAVAAFDDPQQYKAFLRRPHTSSRTNDELVTVVVSVSDGRIQLHQIQ